MTRDGRGSRLLAVLLLLFPLWAVAVADDKPTGLIVRLAAQRPGTARTMAVPPGTRLGRAVTRSGVYKVTVTDGSSLQAKLQQIKSWPGVLQAEIDHKIKPASVPNDPDFKDFQQPYMDPMQAAAAWNLNTGSAPAVVTACVIDSGIDISHKDLKGNLAKPAGISALDIDSSQWPSMVNNVSWYTGVSTDLTDRLGHGTFVAGALGAVGNNKYGVTGAAWKVNIVTCKVFDVGNADVSTVLPCLDYCRLRKSRVMVASWGQDEPSTILQQEIARALRDGALFVTAAGNYNRDNDEAPFYPSQYTQTMPGLVSVAGSENDGSLGWYSSWGRNSVDLFASGTDIYTTSSKDDEVYNPFPGPNAYAFESGTSLAAPLVAGTAVLMASAAGDRLSGTKLKSLLRKSVDKLPAVQEICISGGRLNMLKAVQAAIKCSQPIVNLGKGAAARPC